MINIRKGNTEIVYFTGTEKVTLNNPYFLFVFTNRVTEEVVKVMATNTSTTSRYDKFSLVVNTYFINSTEGLWSYEVREKESVLDLSIDGVIVEQGYMYLSPTANFEPTEYSEQSNEFVTYNGG